MKKETILDKLYTLRDLVVEVKEVLKDLSSDIAQNSQDVEPFYRKLDEMIEKVDRSINNINKEKIAMALFGAFSDGKSSVVSAITKNFNIRIAPEPTTDRVTFYEYENFFIVDTPGTFSHNNLHDEETRKYISEANVILFVVDAVNPIKDSHKDLVKGVLIDMKKLENTIFVLNKMDSVVMDLEDEEEYKEKIEIKKKALLDMLDYLNLSGEAKEKIRVVAVSANPNSLGFDYWSKKWDEYMKVSRIGNLINEIKDVYQKDREKIVYDSGVSVILDVVNELEKMINLEEVKIEVDKLKEHEEAMKDAYNKLNSQLDQASALYRNRINRVKQNYLNRLNLCGNIKELADFVKNHIGENESLDKMRDTIQLEVEDILQAVTDSFMEFERNINTGTKAILLVNPENVEEELINLNMSSINLQEGSLSDISKATFEGGRIAFYIGGSILSLSKFQIMQRLLYFRKVTGLSHFITFTGRGTHMIWASRWASVVQGFGVAARILGIIGIIASFIMKVIEDEEFNNKKTELKSSLENLFSHIGSLESILEQAGIDMPRLQREFEVYLNQIGQQNNKSQKYYEGLRKIVESLRYLKNSL